MKEYDVIVYNTKTEWRFNGILHREDGPAIEYIDGGKMWYVNGVKHRDGGPAVVWYNGTKEWWFNGRLHREDGPAIEYPDGNGSWWINGYSLSESEYKNRTSNCHNKIFNTINIFLKKLKK